MNIQYPTIDRPASPEYVLAVFSDMHRQQCEFDLEADPECILSMHMTVSQWRLACDLLGWRQLGRAYNELWGLSCSDAQWQAVLEPAGQRRLSDVCQFIASRIVHPSIRPWSVFGRSCREAGAFLTIRSILHQAGATARNVHPSTLLDAYTRKHLDMFLGPISRLAPGTLPLVRVERSAYDRAVWCLVASMLGAIVGMLTGLHLVTIGCLLLFLPAYLLTWIVVTHEPTSAQFGNLQTFRDLAVLLANASEIEPRSDGTL